MDWVQVAPILILSNVTPFNIFLLNAKFDKSSIWLCVLISSMLAKIQNGLRPITISSINDLNFKFLYFKIVPNRWVYESNSKYYLIDTKFCVRVKNIENM